LTSRRPNVDQRWLESFQGTGATVKVLAADVTDRENLDSVLTTIRETCPPIAGIANGANVLSDAPFGLMSTEMMLRALGPKIDGSYNLDQAFYHDDLDFFVLFSSISCVIGTAGQSNYVAANGYLNGLARQRRRRGLAASAFDIGLILGIGVAEAAGQHVVDSLQKYGITPLSEPDLRLAFAESIHAGYPSGKANGPGAVSAAVMTSGLRTITTDEKHMVWYDNPIFSHLVIDTKGADGAGDDSRNQATALPVKDQIARATTKEEVLHVLKGKLTKFTALPVDILILAIIQNPSRQNCAFFYKAPTRKSPTMLLLLNLVSIHWSLLRCGPGSSRLSKLTFQF
jgi:hybrid polyketide synthase/nonribosomal peptide synthetase ACE1